MKLLLSSLFFFISCSAQKSLDSSTFSFNGRVVETKEKQYSFIIKAVDVVTLDSLQIISNKESFFRKYKIKPDKDYSTSKKIEVGKSYLFELSKPRRFNVDNMTHDEFIVVEKDTLWDKYRSKLPSPVFAENMRGLNIVEK